MNMDPKLPVVCESLVGRLETLKLKCRPGYMVSKTVASQINEALAIAQAISASVVATDKPQQ